MSTVVQVVIDTAGHWLAPLAAGAYTRACAAGCPPGVTDAGRTEAQQRALYAAYLRGELVATAARPGTSKHETGIALDLPAGGPREWMTRWGRDYGWISGRVAREPWHFEYDAGADRSLAAAPTPTTAPPVTKDWSDMATKEEIAEVVRAELAAALPRVRSVVLADVDGIGVCVVDIGARTYQPLGPGRLALAEALGLDRLRNQGVAFISGFTKLPG